MKNERILHVQNGKKNHPEVCNLVQALRGVTGTFTGYALFHRMALALSGFIGFIQPQQNIAYQVLTHKLR
jgi:hypothetical protein